MKQKDKKQEKNKTVNPEVETKDLMDEKANGCHCCEEAGEEGCNCEENAEAAPSELEELICKLEAKNKECEENYNKFLRMQADFENYKRRIAREREELYYTSLESLVKELLPVVDNLERAICAFKTDELDVKYVDGVDMVCKQMLNILEKNGLKEIEALENEFDPNIHHAVMQVEGDEEEENKVKEVLQKGYTLGSKVIRPSLVKVVVKN